MIKGIMQKEQDGKGLLHRRYSDSPLEGEIPLAFSALSLLKAQSGKKTWPIQSDTSVQLKMESQKVALEG